MLVTKPTLSGKYSFTKGGSRTFPAPMPAKAMIENTINTLMSFVKMRLISPRAVKIRAASSVFINPKRFIM